MFNVAGYGSVSKFGISEDQWNCIRNAVNQTLKNCPSLPHKLKRDEGLPYSILLLPTAEKVTAVVLLKTELGKGACSTVRLGVNLETGDPYAVVKQRFYSKTYRKLLPKEQEMLDRKWGKEDIGVKLIRKWEEKFARFQSGISFMKQLPSCAPQVIGSYIHTSGYTNGKDAFKNSSLCVLSYASRGDLYNAITTAPGLNAEEKSSIASQLLKEVIYMHSQEIAHLDLKPENILLCEDLKVQITDFEFAQTATLPVDNPRGSFQYMAPELALKESRKDPVRADLWSLGLTLYSLFYQDLLMIPYIRNDQDTQRRLAEFASLKNWESSQREINAKLQSPRIPEEWRPVLLKLLRMNPEERQLKFPEV